jgi:exodeoxyribonuclease-1
VKTCHVFYDVETTGTLRGYDQILQIAAVRTDSDLETIDQERFDLRCRRLSYQIPSPGALLVTDFDPEDLERAPLSHYELVRAVHQKFADWSPSVFCGYNSLKFDEIMLRQAFYQTLHPIYLTQINGNRRADVLTMAQAVAIHAPGALKLNESGSFRLGELARANGIDLTEASAHDAMADSKATIQLMQKMRDLAPALYSRMMQNADKNFVIGFVKDNPVFQWSAVFGRNRISKHVTFIGSPDDDRSAMFLFDLAYDPEQFFRLPDDALAEFAFGPLKVIRTVRANGFPIILPLGSSPSGDGSNDPSECELLRRANAIARNEDFRRRIIRILRREFEDRPKATFVEDRIYESFIGNRDAGRCAQFHQIPWEQRPALARFLDDPRLRELATRLIFAEHPELLPEDARRELVAWQMTRMEADGDVPWLSVPAAIAELGRMWRSTDIGTRQRLEKFARYFARIRSVATLFPHGPARADEKGSLLRTGS